MNVFDYGALRPLHLPSHGLSSLEQGGRYLGTCPLLPKNPLRIDRYTSWEETITLWYGGFWCAQHYSRSTRHPNRLVTTTADRTDTGQSRRVPSLLLPGQGGLPAAAFASTPPVVPWSYLPSTGRHLPNTLPATIHFSPAATTLSISLPQSLPLQPDPRPPYSTGDTIVAVANNRYNTPTPRRTEQLNLCACADCNCVSESTGATRFTPVILSRTRYRTHIWSERRNAVARASQATHTSRRVSVSQPHDSLSIAIIPERDSLSRARRTIEHSSRLT